MEQIKIFLISIGAMLLSQATFAQNLATTIKVQAMELSNAVIRNDFNAFVRYMHPAIIDYAGGQEKMRTKMDSAYQMMKQYNVTFKRYWIGNPGEIVEYKNQLQAVLPESTTITTLFGELTAETSMIVVSKDKGKNRWFIDTNVYNADKLKNILPDLSPQLTIPPRKKPKLVSIQE